MLQQKSRNKINPITKKRLPKLLSTSAFTVIELLIAMFIIGLITTVSVANYRAGEKQKRVAIAADTLVNSLHSAQNFVLTGKNTGNTNPGCGTASYYYIQLNYNSTSYNLNAVDKCGTTNVVQKYTLPDNTKIQPNSLQVDGTAVTSSLRVSFYPPYTTIKASLDGRNEISFGRALIIVQTNDNQATKSIEVDGISGRIGEYFTPPAQPDSTPPTVPANLIAIANSGSQINLSWTSSTDNVAVTGYKIFRDGVQINTSATNSFSDTSVAPSTTYLYKVQAYDADGNNSAQSSAASATTPVPPDTTPPTTPTGLTATAVSTTQINLAWIASTDNVGVTGYKIFRSGTQITTSASTSYSDTSLTPSTTYSYTVQAYDAAGNNSPQSSSASATTQSPPGLPGAPNLSVTAGTGQLTLNWTTPPNGGSSITNYKVYRGKTAGSETLLTTLGNVNSYIDNQDSFVLADDPNSYVADSIAKDATYMYILGSWAHSSDSRIEKRLLSNGSLVAGFGTGGIVSDSTLQVSGDTDAIAIDSTYMYTFGDILGSSYDWVIQKRLLTTGALVWSITDTKGAISDAIAIDATNMYLTGSGDDSHWRIEKRLLSTGATVNAFGTSGAISSGLPTQIPYAIAIDATSVYIGGVDNVNNGRIEKRSISTGALVSTFGSSGSITRAPSRVNGIAIDSTYMYDVGRNNGGFTGKDTWFIEKRLLSDGSLVSAFGTAGMVTNTTTVDTANLATGITLDSTYLYAIGYGIGPAQWIFEKRTLATGALVSGFGSGGMILDDTTSLTPYSIVKDATYMYVVGMSLDYRWRIEKRLLSNGNLVLGPLFAGTTYYYKVSAVNAVGEGPTSNEASGTPN